ncbi:MAG: biopolymer transporter ExbD [Silicimonas sp.]|nr:biopolymer transporter ExbD [Silicimonas sp.]
MRQIRRKPKAEPTIALINIVFLMLIFFLVAGTLAPPLDGELNLVETGDLEGRPPPDALVIKPDGALAYRGDPVADAGAFVAQFAEDQRARLRIVPDRALEANRLVEVSRALRAAGVGAVVIVTERALP